MCVLGHCPAGGPVTISRASWHRVKLCAPKYLGDLRSQDARHRFKAPGTEAAKQPQNISKPHLWLLVQCWRLHYSLCNLSKRSNLVSLVLPEGFWPVQVCLFKKWGQQNHLSLSCRQWVETVVPCVGRSACICFGFVSFSHGPRRWTLRLSTLFCLISSDNSMLLLFFFLFSTLSVIHAGTDNSGKSALLHLKWTGWMCNY